MSAAPKNFWQRWGICVLLGLCCTSASAAEAKPNILYILADDLGWGDLKCNNPQSKIATPALDKLAGAGMNFKDAHSGSAVCTPTRYGIMTGRYAWRTRLQNGVLGGYSPPLIAAEVPTVPGFLREQGYHTVCFGKWHLGMEWAAKEGGTIKDYPGQWKVDYAAPIKHGPTTVGFDRYFGISASLDMPPYVFIDNDRATAIPTVDKTWIRKGPAAADFEAVDVLPTLTKKTCEFFKQQGESKEPRQPFFLYLPLNSPHTPLEVAPEWRGKSGLNTYADFVMQTDDAVGQMLQALGAAGLAENTLVIFTSDNGCSPQAKYDELLAKGHNPSGPWRGHKADIFEGGHRVPFLARWPGKIEAAISNEQTICLTDLFATVAAILGAKLPENAAVDSVNFLATQKSGTTAVAREATVHHSINGSFAIRQGPWKLCLCKDSGGWSAPKPGSPAAKQLNGPQLFNLADDPGETKNVLDKNPQVVERLTKLLESYVKRGRSTPGPEQKNDVEVKWRKASAE